MKYERGGVELEAHIKHILCDQGFVVSHDNVRSAQAAPVADHVDTTEDRLVVHRDEFVDITRAP